MQVVYELYPIFCLWHQVFLGLSSAFAMVKYGEGTPLPTDQTNQLVTNGIYKYVRNPMAIAGMGQGIAVSLYFESYHILVYTVLGGVLWHSVVRPIEEENMLKRFGDDYTKYIEKVGLWLPKFSRFRSSNSRND